MEYFVSRILCLLLAELYLNYIQNVYDSVKGSNVSTGAFCNIKIIFSYNFFYKTFSYGVKWCDYGNEHNLYILILYDIDDIWHFATSNVIW